MRKDTCLKSESEIQWNKGIKINIYIIKIENINGNKMQEKCKCDIKLINLTQEATIGREESKNV